MKTFCTTIRIYYEDTDAAGIVYYANYLRFLERGRTELLRVLGYEQSALVKQLRSRAVEQSTLSSPLRMATQQIAFAVRSVHAEYLKPAKLDDLIVVETAVESVGRVQAVFAQRIMRGEEQLLDAKIRVACIDPALGRPVPMPGDIYQQLKALMAQPPAALAELPE
jgi:acyl-CoA thioester hydrolase